jgi:hypothetical protein
MPAEERLVFNECVLGHAQSLPLVLEYV